MAEVVVADGVASTARDEGSGGQAGSDAQCRGKGEQGHTWPIVLISDMNSSLGSNIIERKDDELHEMILKKKGSFYT